MTRSVSVFIIIFLFPFMLTAQGLFRISGDYTIKTKMADGTAQLVIGKFYYDRNIKKIVYVNSFPEKETWVTVDTSLYLIVDNKLVSRQKVPPAATFSIYHLCLSSRLNQFGLQSSPYKIENVEKDDNMVITTWVPPTKLADLFGKVMISNEDRKLFGIVFFDKDGVMVKKQFFDKYLSINGCDFPGEVVEIMYDKGKEHYRVTEYKNVVIDELANENLYNYPIPGS
jgi:hypothetical protein